MPRKRITFIIIPPNDGQVQEFRFSSKLLWVAGLVCIVFIGALGYYVSGYHSRSDQYARVDQLLYENDELVEKFQRTKKTLGQLEGQMSALMADDEKLRAWHEMPPLSGADRRGGMGGEEDIPEGYIVLPKRKRKLLEDIGSKIVQLQYQAKLQEESFAVIVSKFREKASNLKILPTIAPVYRNQARKTSSFGKRIDPFTGNDAFHNGVDFAGRLGTPVYATADGVVKYSYSEEDIKTRLGNVIAIDHNVTGVNDDGEAFVIPGAYRTEYGHLQKRLVKKGEKVQRGQKIGLMGSTGRSTGPHLHYAVRYQQRRAGSPNKGYVDPEDLFILDWPTKEQVPGGLPGGWLAGAGD